MSLFYYILSVLQNPTRKPSAILLCFGRRFFIAAWPSLYDKLYLRFMSFSMMLKHIAFITVKVIQKRISRYHTMIS